MRKGREVTFQAAVDTLNDIAGIRVVCFFVMIFTVWQIM